MSFDPKLEAKIRKQVEQKLAKRTELIQHIIAYVAINPILWSIYLFTNNGVIDGTPWALWITGFWGMGLVAHFFDYYGNYGGGRERHKRLVDRETQREMERERQRLNNLRKLKNDDVYYDDDPYLTDDDEHNRLESR